MGVRDGIECIRAEIGGEEWPGLGEYGPRGKRGEGENKKCEQM